MPPPGPACPYSALLWSSVVRTVCCGECSYWGHSCYVMQIARGFADGQRERERLCPNVPRLPPTPPHRSVVAMLTFQTRIRYLITKIYFINQYWIR